MRHVGSGDLEPQITAVASLTNFRRWTLYLPLPCPLVPWPALPPPPHTWPMTTATPQPMALWHTPFTLNSYHCHSSPAQSKGRMRLGAHTLRHLGKRHDHMASQDQKCVTVHLEGEW